MAKHGGKHTGKLPDPLTNPVGIYEGDAGGMQANQDIPNYYNALQAQSGRTPTNTPADYWDWIENQGLNQFTTGYNNALANNGQLSVKDFGAQTYGQSIGGADLGVNNAAADLAPDPTGKKHKGKHRNAGTNPFGSGTGSGQANSLGGNVAPGPRQPSGGGSLGGQSDSQFLSFLAQSQPQDYFGQRLQDVGLFNAETPSDANDILMNSFYPHQYAAYLRQRQNDPSLYWDQYLA